MSDESKMMLPLPESYVQWTRPLFTSDRLRLVIGAVIVGNSPGSVWVDDADQPRAAFLWDKTHSFYLAGIAHNPNFNQWVKRIFIEQIMPIALEHRLGIFKVYSANEGWHQTAETLFADSELQARDRVFYRGDKLNFPDWRERLPARFQVSSINDEFTALSRLQNFELVTEEIESCWNALNDFRERGFGFCAHDSERIVGWCTSEYVSGKQCGIGIETLEDAQGRGFATLTASAFVEHCQKRGITPHWDAWATNTPSVRVAEKVGFRKIEDYSIWLGKFTA